MRNIIIILLIALTSSCYTKHRAIEKFCSQDTSEVLVKIHDTTYVDKIVADTIFNTRVDSVILFKDKLVIKYKKINDSIFLSGEYKGDTIYKDREVIVEVPCNCPEVIELSWIEKKIIDYKWFILVQIIFLFLLLSIFIKK